ncbi:ABC transporter permease [Haladaptatus sp. CMSO5]|uniref:ABC transporter permease n=1 Tax=Haladaptatus sp. CMSO5 TaxID=3120514 RepID=UPI002FCDF49A
MATSSQSLSDRFTSLDEGQQKWIIRIISLVVVLLVWEGVGRILGNIFFAPFSDVVVAYIDLALNGEMFQTLINSIKEMLIAYALAVAVGIPVGLVMGRVRTVEQLLNPWVSAMFVTATASLLPLFIIFFGIDLTFRLAIVFISSVWFILLNAYHGAKGVNLDFIDVGNSFNASRLKVMKDIVLPETLPYIFTGLRMGLIHALRGIILAETFIAFGYGGMIHEYSLATADTAPILALILTIMIFGYGMRITLQRLQNRIFPWAEDSQSASH